MAVDDLYTKLLLHMDGADNGTMFTDESGKVVTVVGNTCIKSTQKKLGSASAYFDGSGDSLSIPSTEDFAFGTGDFTVDMWIYTQSWGGSNPVLFAVGTTGGFQFGKQEWTSNWGACNWGIAWGVRSTTLPTENAWHHIAAVRASGFMRIYLDGIIVASGSDTNNYVQGPGVIGVNNYNGYIDELRVSKGIARWTSNFIPPIIPYSDAEKKPISLLVVAGGGGGGGSSADAVAGGSGGGAGGYLYSDTYIIRVDQYPIIVGAGGAGGVRGSVGSKGGNSSFADIVAYGGGAGRDADDNNTTISNGGSGGGASGSTGGAAGTGITGQGSAGGTKNDSNAGSYAGGGGGGAGGAASGRTRGIGLASSISGASLIYAEGGYGQGTSNFINGGVSAGANTGNGGNGASNTPAPTGGNGGSGIVIIRYNADDLGICTGGTITTDGTDTIHTFTSSGMFTVTGAPIGTPAYMDYIQAVAVLPEDNSAGVYTKYSFSLYSAAILLCDLTLTNETSDELLVTETANIITAYGMLRWIPKFQALVVAGGGGGGGSQTSQGGSGGGGGGGVIYSTIRIAPGEYPVIIGAGGTGSYATTGINGADSSFANFIAKGGGGGGRGIDTVGNVGGSGGGGGYNKAGGTGTAGQGFSGGAGQSGSPYSGGGGGGAGEAGNTDGGREGGDGLAFSISGVSQYYGGGGGGGSNSDYAGGLGGGGKGGHNAQTGTAGAANAGGGGGGGGNIDSGYSTGGNGGSGVVIIRYPTAAFGVCTGGIITTVESDTIHTFTESGTFTLVEREVNHNLSGTAIFGPYLLPTLSATPQSSAISWDEMVPTDTAIEVCVAIVDTVPENSDYLVATNGATIPGLTGDSSEKNMFIMVSMSTTDQLKTPWLSNMSFELVGVDNLYTVNVLLTDTGRMKYPASQVSVEYIKASGNLQGLLGGQVQDFTVSFDSKNIIPVFNPNDTEHLSTTLSITSNLMRIYYEEYQSENEHINADLVITSILYHINDIPT